VSVITVLIYLLTDLLTTSTTYDDIDALLTTISDCNVTEAS